jgi:DNA-binding NtrC family response regulator
VQENSSERGPSRPSFVRPRARVLLVDDEPAVLLTAAALLGDVFDVLTARNGEIALEEIHRTSFDVICTDYHMGGITGIELLRRASSLPGLRAGVLVTGFGDYEESWTDRKRSDLYSVLLKPYDPQQLLDTVERAASRVQVRRRVSDASAEAKRTAAQVVTDLTRRNEPR